MELKHAQFLVAAADYNGNEATLRKDYSGRGMMGKTTVGVVVDHALILFADVVTYIKEMSLENPDFLKEVPDFESFHTDNMGQGFIIY